MRRLLLPLVGLLAAACGIFAGDGSLKTVPAADTAACPRIALQAVLHGDASDPAVAWIELVADGRRQEVVWPSGYRAEFPTVGGQPVLQVLDASGRSVIGESDVIGSACTTRVPGTYLLVPPFD